MMGGLAPTPQTHGLENLDQRTLVQRSYVTPKPEVDIEKAPEECAPAVTREEFESLRARVSALESEGVH